MSNYVFSPSQKIIFPKWLRDAYQVVSAWPEDGIEISDEIADEFNGQYPTGKTLGHDDENKPCWVEVPPPSEEEVKYAAEVKKQALIDEANAYINSKQWPSRLALGRLSEEEKGEFNLWLDYLDNLNAVDSNLCAELTWPLRP